MCACLPSLDPPPGLVRGGSSSRLNPSRSLATPATPITTRRVTRAVRRHQRTRRIARHDMISSPRITLARMTTAKPTSRRRIRRRSLPYPTRSPLVVALVVRAGVIPGRLALLLARFAPRTIRRQAPTPEADLLECHPYPPAVERSPRGTYFRRSISIISRSAASSIVEERTAITLASCDTSRTWSRHRPCSPT
jgi:hypothetical protein